MTSDNQNETQSRLYFLNEQLQKMVKELPRLIYVTFNKSPTTLIICKL